MSLSSSNTTNPTHGVRMRPGLLLMQQAADTLDVGELTWSTEDALGLAGEETRNNTPMERTARTGAQDLLGAQRASSARKAEERSKERSMERRSAWAYAWRMLCTSWALIWNYYVQLLDLAPVLCARVLGAMYAPVVKAVYCEVRAYTKPAVGLALCAVLGLLAWRHTSRHARHLWAWLTAA